MSKNNYFVIHGSFGSPFGNWFKWFYENVSKRDNQVIIPQFPIGIQYQNYNNCKSLLDYYKDLNIINNNTIFVGHSIGAIFIVKYLIENNIKLGKIILVSGFNNYTVDGGDYDKVNSSFFADNITGIKKLVKEIICIYGDNDPYVKQEALSDFADKIATSQIVIKNGGHLNAESGYVEFNEIITYLN